MKNGKELIVIILVAIAVRLPWLVMIPQAEAPDENMHRWVVNYISDNCCLPDKPAIIQSGIEAAYGSVPPFGYLPHIIFLKLLSVARLGSLLMSLVVITASWWVGRKLFSDNHLAALAVPLMIVFHPQFVFVSSYINNDITTAALCGLILVNIMVAVNNKFTVARTLILAVLLSWLILSKYSGLPVFLTALLAFLIIANQQKLFTRLQYLSLLLFFITLMTSSWFYRNYCVFDGDILGLKTMNSLWAITYHQQISPNMSPLTIIFSSQFWRTLFFSFWGWFGYMTHSLPKIIYYGYLLFVLLAGYFGLRNWHTIKNSIKTRNYSILFAVCFLLNIAACIYCCFNKISGPQGRYLFPSEIPIMVMLVAGLLSAKKQWSSKLIIAMLAFNIFAYCYSTFFIYQLYSHI